MDSLETDNGVTEVSGFEPKNPTIPRGDTGGLWSEWVLSFQAVDEVALALEVPATGPIEGHHGPKSATSGSTTFERVLARNDRFHQFAVQQNDRIDQLPDQQNAENDSNG